MSDTVQVHDAQWLARFFEVTPDLPDHRRPTHPVVHLPLRSFVEIVASLARSLGDFPMFYGPHGGVLVMGYEVLPVDSADDVASRGVGQ